MNKIFSIVVYIKYTEIFQESHALYLALQDILKYKNTNAELEIILMSNMIDENKQVFFTSNSTLKREIFLNVEKFLMQHQDHLRQINHEHTINSSLYIVENNKFDEAFEDLFLKQNKNIQMFYIDYNNLQKNNEKSKNISEILNALYNKNSINIPVMCIPSNLTNHAI